MVLSPLPNSAILRLSPLWVLLPSSSFCTSEATPSEHLHIHALNVPANSSASSLPQSASGNSLLLYLSDCRSVNIDWRKLVSLACVVVIFIVSC